MCDALEEESNNDDKSTGSKEEMENTIPQMIQEELIPITEDDKNAKIEPIDSSIKNNIQETQTKEEYLESIDEKIMTIDDFLDNLYI